MYEQLVHKQIDENSIERKSLSRISVKSLLTSDFISDYVVSKTLKRNVQVEQNFYYTTAMEERIKNSNFYYNGKMCNICFMDLETTGLGKPVNVGITAISLFSIYDLTIRCCLCDPYPDIARAVVKYSETYIKWANANNKKLVVPTNMWSPEAINLTKIDWQTGNHNGGVFNSLQ